MRERKKRRVARRWLRLCRRHRRLVGLMFLCGGPGRGGDWMDPLVSGCRLQMLRVALRLVPMNERTGVIR